LPVGGYVTVKVYDVPGNELATLVNQEYDITSLKLSAQNLST
jgi:hypothetical protein